MPKVSVVIPCYNHGQYLDEAVNSILKQTYQDFEIIIVNDGSTDPFTAEKLRNYYKPKTTIIHTENRGPSAARNTGIRAAKGEYIVTLDADDWFAASFLEKAKAIIEQYPAIGVVTCGIQDFGISTKRHFPQGGDVTNFLVRGIIGSVFFRKCCWEQTKGYDEQMRTAGYEDWNFILEVTKRGWKVHVIEEYLLYYRRHPFSRKTKSDASRPEFVRQIVKNHHDLFAQYVEEVIFEKEQKILSLKQAKNAILHSKRYRVGKWLLLPLEKMNGALKKLFRFFHNTNIISPHKDSKKTDGRDQNRLD